MDDVAASVRLEGIAHVVEDEAVLGGLDSRETGGSCDEDCEMVRSAIE